MRMTISAIHSGDLKGRSVLVNKLDRMSRHLQHLSTMMRSYKYEPQTISLYLQSDELKTHLRTLVGRTNTLLQRIKTQKEITGDPTSLIKEMNAELIDLENEVFVYLKKAKSGL